MGEDGRKDRAKAGERSSGAYKWLASFQRDLMAGAVMGGVVHTIVASIKRAKLLLQTQESNIAIIGGDGRRRFKGMLDCTVRTIREEGILSLERSLSQALLPTAPMVYSVIYDPAIVNNPDIQSYQQHVHGRGDPPALILLQMHGVELEADFTTSFKKQPR